MREMGSEMCREIGLACGSLSNNTKWLSYTEHVGRDTNSRKSATEDRCENHGRVYILYFSTLMSWEEFSESYRSKPQFKARVNDLVASLPPLAGDATRERDDKSDSCTLATETFHFLETKREVELVSEKTLCLRLKRKTVPPDMKSIPVLNVPVFKEDPSTNLGRIVYEPMYVFGSPGENEHQRAALVTMTGVKLQTHHYSGPERFDGHAEALLKSLVEKQAQVLNHEGLQQHRGLQTYEDFIQKKLGTKPVKATSSADPEQYVAAKVVAQCSTQLDAVMEETDDDGSVVGSMVGDDEGFGETFASPNECPLLTRACGTPKGTAPSVTASTGSASAISFRGSGVAIKQAESVASGYLDDDGEDLEGENLLHAKMRLLPLDQVMEFEKKGGWGRHIRGAEQAVKRLATNEATMSMSLALQEYIDDVLLARKLQKETIFTLDEVKVDAIIAKMLGRTPPPAQILS